MSSFHVEIDSISTATEPSKPRPVVELSSNVSPTRVIEVTNATMVRGPRGPEGKPGDGTVDIAAHEGAEDPHSVAGYAILKQISNLAAGRTLYVQMSGDPAPTGLVDGDIVIREI